jgi:excisionase family DNA binding protein
MTEKMSATERRSAAARRGMTMLGEEPLASADEVGAFLGIHRATVYRLAGVKGGIPCVQIGKSIRFRPAEVRRYLERQTIRDVGADRADRLLGDAAAS